MTTFLLARPSLTCWMAAGTSLSSYPLVKAGVNQTDARRGPPKNCPRNCAPHQSLQMDRSGGVGAISVPAVPALNWIRMGVTVAAVAVATAGLVVLAGPAHAASQQFPADGAFMVPAAVCSLTITATGGAGAGNDNAGGSAGSVTANFPVSPGDVLSASSVSRAKGTLAAAPAL
jgi:hypothetical protein